MNLDSLVIFLHQYPVNYKNLIICLKYGSYIPFLEFLYVFLSTYSFRLTLMRIKARARENAPSFLMLIRNTLTYKLILIWEKLVSFNIEYSHSQA